MKNLFSSAVSSVQVYLVALIDEQLKLEREVGNSFATWFDACALQYLL